MTQPRAGFLLTRHWRDTPQGTELTFWLATDDGPLEVTLPPQESVAFIPESQRPQAERLLQGENGTIALLRSLCKIFIASGSLASTAALTAS